MQLMRWMDNFQPTKNYSHELISLSETALNFFHKLILNDNIKMTDRPFFFTDSVQVRDEKLRAELIH